MGKEKTIKQVVSDYSLGGLMEKTICELFAGVGGFRLGFDRLNKNWETVWFSQWEPGAKTQWAYDCYVKHFGNCKDNNGKYHTGDDIATVNKADIPKHTLLVGGFPCQDYSVARSKVNAQGIEGKKGVLWWQINEILEEKNPPFCLFENVDRLLKSPSNQRGRDFGVIIACLLNKNYTVEWRVVNASEYGAAQRRRRTFIFAYKDSTNYGKGKIDIKTDGLMAKSFPAIYGEDIETTINTTDILDVSNNFKFDFKNAGYAKGNRIVSYDAKPIIEEPIKLKNILVSCTDEKYYENVEKRYDKWIYLKGAKKIERTTKTGFKYIFSEGPVGFPDAWDKPGRTMLTSESTLNRSSHVVSDVVTGRLRTLLPLEAERLQGFDDNWTEGMPERMRFFCMGNALVVPMITRLGRIIDTIIESED